MIHRTVIMKYSVTYKKLKSHNKIKSFAYTYNFISPFEMREPTSIFISFNGYILCVVGSKRRGRV